MARRRRGTGGLGIAVQQRAQRVEADHVEGPQGNLVARQATQRLGHLGERCRAGPFDRPRHRIVRQAGAEDAVDHERLVGEA